MSSSDLVNESLVDIFPWAEGLSEKAFEDRFKLLSKEVCKPCWELKYCPYGSLIEEYPLLPSTRKDAIEHMEYFRECIRTGILASGELLDNARRKWFQKDLDSFDPNAYIETIPEILLNMSCSVFGHLCPVFFLAESYTETGSNRKKGRSMSYSVRARVARRDNNQCQICGKVLKDQELEFDHVIPISQGGSSEEGNLQVSCLECNRRKGSRFIPNKR